MTLVALATAAVLAQEATLAWRGVPPGLEADLAASAGPDFAVVSARPEGDAWTWTVLPLSTGPVAFTPRWRGPDGPVEGPAARLVVAEPAPASPGEAPADIKPPLPARPPLWPWALAAVLLAAFLRWRASRRGGGIVAAAAPPARPPEEEAADALDRLSASGLWERDPAGYYARLTAILRRYFERRWGEPAEAMTSAEVARLVKRRAGDLRLSAEARELLSRADLVKFAKARPASGDGPADAERALALVRATTPPPPAPEEARR